MQPPNRQCCSMGEPTPHTAPPHTSSLKFFFLAPTVSRLLASGTFQLRNPTQGHPNAHLRPNIDNFLTDSTHQEEHRHPRVGIWKTRVALHHHYRGPTSLPPTGPYITDHYRGPTSPTTAEASLRPRTFDSVPTTGRHDRADALSVEVTVCTGGTQPSDCCTPHYRGSRPPEQPLLSASWYSFGGTTLDLVEGEERKGYRQIHPRNILPSGSLISGFTLEPREFAAL